MTSLPDQLAVCDANIAKWATQLKVDDLCLQEAARKKINSWLDTRLALMREEDVCDTQSSVRSRSLPR